MLQPRNILFRLCDNWMCLSPYINSLRSSFPLILIFNVLLMKCLVNVCAHVHAMRIIQSVCCTTGLAWERSDDFLPWQALLSQVGSIWLHMGAHQQSESLLSSAHPNNTNSCAHRAQPAGSQTTHPEPSSRRRPALPRPSTGYVQSCIIILTISCRLCGCIHESAQTNSSSLMCSPPLCVRGWNEQVNPCKPGMSKSFLLVEMNNAAVLDLCKLLWLPYGLSLEFKTVPGYFQNRITFTL